MPALVAWFANIFAQFLAFFGLQLTKKTAYAVAAIAAFLGLTTAFTLGIKAMLSGIVYAFPDIPAAAFAFIPSNAAICISTLFAARMARFIYDYNVQALKIVASIH